MKINFNSSQFDILIDVDRFFIRYHISPLLLFHTHTHANTPTHPRTHSHTHAYAYAYAYHYTAAPSRFTRRLRYVTMTSRDNIVITRMRML